MAANVTKVSNLHSLLQSLCNETYGETVTVADLLNAVGRRSYGPVLLLLGFVAISPLTIIPGATWIVAVVTLVFALQIVIGREYPWVPSRALRVTFDRKHLIAAIGSIDRYARMIDRVLAPRLVFLTKAPFVQIVALACVAAALVTFPLSFIPFGPVLPGLTILFFGLALTARDGMLLILAGGTLCSATYVMLHVWSALPFT